MFFKGIDIGKTTVNTIFDGTFYPVTRMQQSLLPEVMTEHAHNCILHTVKHLVSIMPCKPGNGLNHILKHQDIFDFSHIGNKNVFPSQITYLFFVTPVTVNDSTTFKMMEGTQIIKSTGSLDYLVATPQSFDTKILKNQRIKFGIYGVCCIAFYKHHRTARPD